MIDSGHSRFPVFDDRRESVVGILLAKDLLSHGVSAEKINVKDILRAAVFVPESKRLNICNKILNQIGIKTKLGKDKIKIYGNPSLKLNKSYTINTYHDHRIAALAFITAQIFISKGRVAIKNFENIKTSFPSFLKLMKQLNCKYEITKNN